MCIILQLQLLTILLEYGGEHVVDRILTRLQTAVDRSEDMRPEAKQGLNKCIDGLKFIVPYVRGFHTSLFYINGGKYHISKRLTGINYVCLVNYYVEADLLILIFR